MPAGFPQVKPIICFIEPMNYIDSIDANGFWEGYTVNSVHGRFYCDIENCDNNWRSVQIQVDMKAFWKVLWFLFNETFKFRFNFHENRGEVKIEREWRQKCSLEENHSGDNGASEYFYPDLVEEEGARWVMKSLRYIIFTSILYNFSVNLRNRIWRLYYCTRY